MTFCHFGNHRQSGKCGVACTCHQCHQESDNRSVEGDSFRMFT
ncbi:Uncharacterised protein [Vibrio cholerae]|nr:Uncharacterised protein [Vibrio cholerae]CSI92250.1 Uncharacterised protein [Vibrio cholerae]